MNSSMWAYFIVLLGILGIVIINTSTNLLMTNEQDYFILKETTEAAMIDAIDMEAYRSGLRGDADGGDGVTVYSDPTSMYCGTGQPGTIRILKEKFVENFVRRFANNIDMARKYKIIINDIDECPPKVSVTMMSSQHFDFVKMFSSAQMDDAAIVNRITAILEEYPRELETELDYNFPPVPTIESTSG